MAHPTSATETIISPVTGGCSPEGFGGLRITGCWINEAPALEGWSGLEIGDSGTQI